MGKPNFGEMRNALTTLGLKIQLRVKLLKSFIWDVSLHERESWTRCAQKRRRLEVAEVWLRRGMLRIQWIARRTNQQVLQETRTSRSLLPTIG